ncbi:VOC family protein [Pseudoroseicyclus sp. CXY001]|uniref:VOC family protein n=1 Tax=Pseudoroseicyclus sp. CXY001 TaxID=3242492 RepID=UPI003571274E
MTGELSPAAQALHDAGEPAVPFRMVGIDHVVLLVGDMDEALHFYCDVLSCRPGYSFPHLAMEQVWCGPQLIVLVDITDPKAAAMVPKVAGGRNVDHVCLNITATSREVLRAHFTKHGVTIDTEALHSGARGMGESTYIFDPWGNRLEIKGPPLL